jgi:nucleoside-diphosphate-sugar epimerase
MSETFLVTGGQGFIGAWVVRRLLEEGVSAVIFDRAPDNGILSQVVDPERLAVVERVFGDVADPARVAAAVRDHGITHVIHLAGLQVPACRADPVLGARVNVLGTLSVFEAVRKSAGQVRMTVYASSAAVAGDVPEYDAPIADDAAHVPKTHYGVFKAANEGNARVYFIEHGIPSVGLRPYTVYGVGREVGITSGPTKAIKAAVLGRRFEVPFTGPTSFVLAEDLARIFIGASRARVDGALALNVRGAVDTVERFLELLGGVVPAARGRITAAGPPIPIAYDLDEHGLEALLGAAGIPRAPLEEGIRRTVEHFRELSGRGRLHDRDLGSTS